MKRVTHSGKYNATLTDYLREVACICPSCSGLAYVTAESKYAIPWRPENVKFFCTKCAHRVIWPSNFWKSNFESYNPGNGYEPYFGFKLYVVKQVCQTVFAVLSCKHAKDLAEYIAAQDRPSPMNSKWSMVNRLPTSLKLAKNRKPVLKALNCAIKELGC